MWVTFVDFLLIITSLWNNGEIFTIYTGVVHI